MSDTAEDQVQVADQFLADYGQTLIKPLSLQLRIEHTFLHVHEEAVLERESLFSEENFADNEKVINELRSKLSIQNELFCMGEIVFASVGTSSTQVYHQRVGVLAAYYVGAGALSKDPVLASQLLESIYLRMEEESLTGYVVLFNAIGYLVSESVNLSVAKDEDRSFLLEEEPTNEASLRSMMAAARIRAQESAIETVIMLQKKPKLENGWLPVYLRLYSTRYLSLGENGFYLVDFGGGGPDLFYHDPVTKEMISVAKDRSLRKEQDLFVDEMVSRKYSGSKSFNSIVEFLRRSILTHALDKGLDGALDCLVVQTGKARQQHFLGHTDPSCKPVRP